MASNPAGQVTALESLPAPVAGDMVAASRPYVIGPFDRLEVEVFGVEELQRELQTDASGGFTFPLIGRVDAAGLTPIEVAQTIEQRLAGRYVRNPQVTINLKESLGQQVTVDGQVEKPGQYAVLGNLTLMRTVALAGGMTELAKLDDVLVFRKVAGQQYVGIYNMAAIRRGNYPDPDIYSNDIVIVGDSKQRRFFRDLLQLSPILTTPIIVLSQQL